MLAFLRQQLLAFLAKVLVQKASFLLGTIGASVLPVLLYWEVYLSTLIPSPQAVWAVRSIGLLILTIFLSVALYLWPRPKLKAMPFGVHKDIKTGEYYCSRCYLKDKKRYLLETAAHGWRCIVCGKYKEDPENRFVPSRIEHHWNKRI